MDREQILEDLKEWLWDQYNKGGAISALSVVYKIEELEELYE